MTNDKDSAVLLPCPVPWCEKVNPPQVWSPDYAPMYTVDCPDCGLETDDFPTKAEAVAAWNTRQPTQSDEEAYYLGKRDGYETAVQDIDMLTGGDGEYCYSTIEGERHCPNPDSMKARIAERFNSQPTQSDALKCEYCDNTGICGWDDNPQFCGECSHGDAAFKGWNARIPVYALKVVREKAIEECAKALEADAMKCDCAAVEERECGCGAWCEWKSITSARAVEIVRELKNVPPPEGDGGHRRSDGVD
jgi:hypothetical protein